MHIVGGADICSFVDERIFCMILYVALLFLWCTTIYLSVLGTQSVFQSFVYAYVLL